MKIQVGILAVVMILLVACGKETRTDTTEVVTGKYGCTGTLEEVERCEKTKEATKPTEFVPMDHSKGW